MGSVDVDRQDWDAFFVFEPLQPVQHFFDAAYGERRDDQFSAGCGFSVTIDARRAPLSSGVVQRQIAICGPPAAECPLPQLATDPAGRATVASQVAAEQDRLVAGGARARMPIRMRVTGVDELDGYRGVRPGSDPLLRALATGRS